MPFGPKDLAVLPSKRNGETLRPPYGGLSATTLGTRGILSPPPTPDAAAPPSLPPPAGAWMICRDASPGSRPGLSTVAACGGLDDLPAASRRAVRSAGATCCRAPARMCLACRRLCPSFGVRIRAHLRSSVSPVVRVCACLRTLVLRSPAPAGRSSICG